LRTNGIDLVTPLYECFHNRSSKEIEVEIKVGEKSYFHPRADFDLKYS